MRKLKFFFILQNKTSIFSLQSSTIIVHRIFSTLLVRYNDLCTILVFYIVFWIDMSIYQEEFKLHYNGEMHCSGVYYIGLRL